MSDQDYPLYGAKPEVYTGNKDVPPPWAPSPGDTKETEVDAEVDAGERARQDAEDKARLDHEEAQRDAEEAEGAGA